MEAVSPVRVRVPARLVLAIVALCTAAAGWPQGAADPDTAPSPAVEDEAGLDAHLAALKPAVCASDQSLCRHFKAFAAAMPPCFAQGEHLTVGHAQVIARDGTIAPAEYFAVRAQRARDVILLQTQHVYSENAEEKQAAEDLVLAVRSGSIDPANPLYRYLEGRSGEVPQLLAQRDGRTLVVRHEGPALYLRQAGKLLYVAVPDAVVSPNPQTTPLEGLLFAVLPATASCQ